MSGFRFSDLVLLLDTEIPENRVRSLRFQGGFTLMELIVVCVLIGVMLAITLPTMDSSPFSDPLKGSTRKAMGFVAGLRELAVRQQQPYLLHISQIENRLWYEKDLDTQEDFKDKKAKQQLQFPQEIAINEIWIGGDGSSFEDKSVVWISKQGFMNHTIIQLTSDEGEELSLQFHPFTDTATISERFEIPVQQQ